MAMETKQSSDKSIKKDSLNTHIRTVHSSKRQKCELCGKDLKKHHIKNHMLLVHKMPYQIYACDICDEAFMETTRKTMTDVHNN